MKKYSQFFKIQSVLLLFLIFSSINTKAQNSCDLLENYIPNSNTPILEFNVNVHLFSPVNGVGIYDNITNAQVEAYIYNLNQIYTNFVPPVAPVNPPAVDIADSRIRFHLVGVYRPESDALYDINDANNNGGAHVPINQSTAINIFFFTNSLYINNAGGNADASSFTINMVNTDFFSSYGTLAHELGHIFNLLHTFGSGDDNPCNSLNSGNLIGDDIFPDTYYPDPNINTNPASANTSFTACDGNTYTVISNNLMGYNGTRNYLSPLQMAYMHRYALTNNEMMAKIKDINVYDAQASITINANTIWNSSMVVKGDLIINTGATLTVNCNVFFTSQGKVIVKPGGKLIVNGGSLKPVAPNILWQGVFVGGYPNLDQFPTSNQGICILNNATLENMSTGVCNLNYPISGFGGIEGSGGVIKATGSIFRNNQYGINLYPYQNKRPSGYIANDFSYVFDCNFNMDYKALTLFPQMQYTSFIRLNGIKGIRLLGNLYEIPTVVSAQKNPHERPIGINSTNSSFTVDDYCLTPNYLGGCNSFASTYFKNLFYGIRAFNYNPNLTIKINKAKFWNNYRGIYLSGVDNSTISYNLFQVLPLDNSWNDPNVNEKQPYGLYLDGSTGFLVSKNEFNMLNTTYDQNYGIIINNSGDQTNQIYDNQFEQMYVGIQAQSWNRSTISDATLFSNDGLKIGCNDFISNVKKNILVLSDGTNTGGVGISVFQGKPLPTGYNINNQKMLAGNTFTNTGIMSDWDFYNSSSCPTINYYCHNYIDGIPIESLPVWVPRKKNNLIINKQNNSGQYDKEKTCPLKAELQGRTFTDIRNDMVAYKSQLQSSVLILGIWVDGGDPELPEAIEGAYPWETYQLYNDLMLESPYLSDNSIIAAINNVEVLPEALLKLVIIANPHAISSQEVVEAIENRLPSLSQTTYDEIMGHIEDYSPLRDLQADVAYWAQEYYLTLHEFKRAYLSDSVNTWNADSLNALLSREDKISYKLELASNYFFQGNTSEYEDILGEMTTENDDDLIQKTEFQSFFNVIDNFDYQLAEIQNVDPEDVIALQELANTGKSKYANYARSILFKIVPEYNYYEPILDYTGGSSRIDKNQSIVKDLEEKPNFNIYPNPANNYMIIEPLKDFSDLSYVIYSSDGKLIKSERFNQGNNAIIIDLSQLSTGNYSVVLKSGEQIIDQKIFQVVR